MELVPFGKAVTFFFLFKAVTFVLEEQDRFQTESTASKRSTWLLFTWRLESKRKWARQRDKEHKLLDSKRHEHTEGPVSILVWATRVLSEESKLIMKFLVVDHRRLPTQKKVRSHGEVAAGEISEMIFWRCKSYCRMEAALEIGRPVRKPSRV